MTKSTQITQSLRAWMDTFMHRSMRSWMHFAKSTGISMPQFSILMQLHYRGTCSISDISERFDITAAAASQLAEKLVKGGYIERAEDPSDRRAKVLQLALKGKKLVEAGIEERYRWMDEVVLTLNAEQRTKVAEALEILASSVKRETE